MKLTKHTSILLRSLISAANAQDHLDIGFGDDLGVFDVANEHPLNQTHLNFLGFNFEADPASTTNASAGQWTLNMGLSIVNTETNQTNYPLSAAANTTSNYLNIVYTLDFPGNQLLSPNDTDWTICWYVMDIPWTKAVLKRASGDHGDCSTVLGASYLARVHQSWTNPSSSATSGCPAMPDFISFPECNSISTDGYSGAFGEVSAVLSNPQNISSDEVGLRSGQPFSWARSDPFGASTAQTNFTDFASKLRMMVMTFAPSVNYTANHMGLIQTVEVRTFCNAFDKAIPAQNLGINRGMSFSSWVAMGFPTLLIVWEALFMLDI